jgi:uncharacterized membrane protein
VTGGALRLYLAVKFLHVIGAAILFGTGLGIAFFPFRAAQRGARGNRGDAEGGG